MKLYILTIVLDGMPFLPMQLNTFNRLTCDWLWMIVEGAAANVNCTRWCKPQEARFSTDGSHEFIMDVLWNHPRVKVISKKYWTGGKVEMCNAPLEKLTEPGILMEIDADELWQPDRIDAIPLLLNERTNANTAQFFCRYFVGPNLITVGENCYGNNPGEWARAWKFSPGMRFLTHEPPVLTGNPIVLHRDYTRTMHHVFDHWAYVFESQLRYKEQFYGYRDALAQWQRLQQHPGPWPVKLGDFLPWVDGKAMAAPLHIV